MNSSSSAITAQSHNGQMILRKLRSKKKNKDVAIDYPCEEVYQNANECDENDMCAWCESPDIPALCMPIEQARELPSKYFKCDKVDLNETTARRVGEKHYQNKWDYDFSSEWNLEDGRKMAYRLFAPNYWEEANQELDVYNYEQYGGGRKRHGHGRHHPNVKADANDDKDEKNAVKDWPVMRPMCPVMFFMIGAAIFLVCHLKFLEKAAAKLEFLKQAKKLVNKANGGKKRKGGQVL